ncbi:hypothetical protein [Streptomyces purpureus]|uniref:hypothetical protein n=1 Tax=Streptomyces purpureus TaxID=1951 RepID=UPI0003810ECA|nr:hypothetical protein [Streptomyces purpureus]
MDITSRGRAGRAGCGLTVRLQDGTEVAWQGFDTGPRVHREEHLAGYSSRLLGLTPAQAAERASRVLRPYRAAGAPVPALVLQGATPATRLFEGDVSDLAAGRAPYDCATYMETRAVFTARTGDLVVGRTPPWREAAEVFGAEAVDLGDVEHYYLCQALLAAADRHTGDETGTPMARIVGWLRAHPHAVVRPYALDGEMQVFLLWLVGRAGVESLRIEANSLVVSKRWNSKRHIHPVVDDAEALSVFGVPPHEVLAAEQRLSEGCRRLGLVMPVLPGYTLARREEGPKLFADDAVRAAELLRRRYLLQRAFLKPTEAGDGARIVGPIDLGDTDALRAAATEAHQYGDDYLLEAAVDYLRLDGAGGARLPVAPSGHVREGKVAPGLTLQVLSGHAWEGNVFVDGAEWDRCGLPPALYGTMRQAMTALQAAFLSEAAVADGSHGGLVTGGVDFAVGRIGGVFQDRVLAAAIDYNLSSHGAEYLRSFHEKTASGPAGRVAEPYAATRLFRPTATATLKAARMAVLAAVPEGARAELVACVPGRWGMVAATGTGVRHAMAQAERLVDVLVAAGLAQVRA